MIKLTFSQCAYLFADKLLPQRGKLVNLDKHPSGEKIPFKPLGNLLTLAAFTYLSQNGYLSLKNKAIKKLIFFPAKDIFAEKLKPAPTDLGGLEQIILTHLNEETSVRQLSRSLLDDQETSPWGQVVSLVKKELAGLDILKTEAKPKVFSVAQYSFNQEKESAFAPLFKETKEALDRFRREVADLSLIESAIEKGIASRQEHEDGADLDS